MNRQVNPIPQFHPRHININPDGPIPPPHEAEVHSEGSLTSENTAVIICGLVIHITAQSSLLSIEPPAALLVLVLVLGLNVENTGVGVLVALSGLIH